MDSVEFMAWDEVLELHRYQLEQFGGQDGFTSENTVRSALARAQFTFRFVPEATLAELAADYMFGLAITQGFLDGNKRTALATASTFLNKNGYRMIITDKLMYLIAMAVANGQLDREGLAEILESHMAPIED